MGKETGLLEKIELLIPGFHGYKRKELIREDDRLVRERVAAFLDDARRELEKALNRCLMLDCGMLEALDRVRKKAMMVAGRIRHADYGYSGLFDRVKVREDELGRLLDYDYRLLSIAKDVLEACRGLTGSIADRAKLADALMELDERLEELDRLILERNRMFKME
jgi:hypothetical protein